MNIWGGPIILGYPIFSLLRQNFIFENFEGDIHDQDAIPHRGIYFLQ